MLRKKQGLRVRPNNLNHVFLKALEILLFKMLNKRTDKKQRYEKSKIGKRGK